MTRKIFSIVVACLMVTVFSCKNHKCVCKDADGNKTITELNDRTRKEARDACDVADAAAQLAGGSCRLRCVF